MIKIVQVVNEIEISKRTKNKNSFSKAKRKAKVPNFQENSLAFQLRIVGKFGVS